VTSLIQEIADQFKLHSRGKDIAYYQHKFFSRLLSIATPGATRHASRRPSPGPAEGNRSILGSGSMRQEGTGMEGAVDAQHLAQRISFSLVSNSFRKFAGIR
jgi:hypothetical protein